MNAESKEWKSQLTVESVMEMTEIKALFREKDVRNVCMEDIIPQDASYVYCNVS